MKMRVNQPERKSLFVVVEYNDGPYDGALYEMKLEHGQSGGEAAGGAGIESPLPVLDPVFKFFDKSFELPTNCLFEGARLGRSKLYLMANGHGWPHKRITTTNSFVFDTDSASDLQHFSPPEAAKPFGAVIYAYGMLYYFAHPSCSPEIPDPSFEQYNPTTNSWRRLPSYPYKTLPNPGMEVTGYAVCYGYILISMYNHREHAVVAFHIDTEKWHVVQVSESKKASSCYPFRGRAVVVDNIIYALSWRQDQVIAFSFWRDSDDNCFLGTPLSLRVRNTPHPPSPLSGRRTQNLVHLGTLDFCLIQTGRNEYSIEHQYLCVTIFRILREGEGLDIRTLRSSVFQIGIKGGGYFHVNFSFTPDCGDIEPEEKYCPTESAWTSEAIEIKKIAGGMLQLADKRTSFPFQPNCQLQSRFEGILH